MNGRGSPAPDPGQESEALAGSPAPDPAAVNRMFGRIAGRYDRANHLLSGGMDFSWRRRLTREVVKTRPRDVIDLATGSGDVAFSLCRALPADTRIAALDFCQPMLDEAEKKRAADPVFQRIGFTRGDILDLPFGDESFDVATIAFGLRNLADRHRGLREIHRILRPGGKVFILEFTQPAKLLRPLYFFYLKRILPRVAGRVTGDRQAYEYLNDTISSFPDRAGIARELAEAGFGDVRARGLTGAIVALHEGTK